MGSLLFPVRRRYLDQYGVDDSLQQKRDKNDRRLKSTFESIFEKYERDFEGIGDEIDMETGQVIVENGHLLRMRHEGDAGVGGSEDMFDTDQDSVEDQDTDASSITSEEDTETSLALKDRHVKTAKALVKHDR